MSLKSLDFKILAIVLVTCIAVGVLSGLIIAHFGEKQTIDEKTKILRMTNRRYTSQIEDLFRHKKDTGEEANRIVLGLLTKPEKPPMKGTLKRGSDGAVRLADNISGMFLPRRTAVTPELKATIGALQDAWPILFPLMNTDFETFYVILGDGFIYETPKEWPLTIDPDHDFTKDVFYYIADPAHNPGRSSQWTPVYYDSIQKKWMTSLIIPLYVDGRFCGVTGSDYILDNLFQEILEVHKVEGWCNAFIFSEKGNMIVHPDLMDAILKRETTMNEKLSTKGLDDPGLQALIDRAMSGEDLSEKVISFDYQGKEQFACISTIYPRKWRLVIYTDAATVKKELIDQKQMDLFLTILIAIVVGLAVRIALRNLVIKRIDELAKAASQIGEGKWDAPLPPEKPDEIGTLTRTFRVMSDEIRAHVTHLEQRVAERTQALAENQQRLQTIMDSVQELIVMKDCEGRYMVVNHSWEQAMGVKRDDITGKSAFDVFPRETAQAITKLEKEVMQSGRSSTAEQEIYHPDGSRHVYLITQVPLKDTSGAVFCLITSSTDITELMELQEELRKAKEAADEANRAKGEFLARMSHEIRTPMNAIIGMSHLALQTELTAKQEDYIAKVNQSAHSLLGIINDILDFSKIEAGKLELESIEFELDEVLDKVASLTALKAEEKGLELLFSRDEAVPDYLLGDPLRLSQVLINLTNNAVKFTESGEVVIETELVSSDATHFILQFSVHDTGIGITKDNMSRLFESFSQADGSTTRKYGGTGLGLAICRRIAELMGGRIWVESESGKGSTFSFTAVFGISPKQRIPHLAPSPDLSGKRALIVDDSKTARTILSHALKSFRFEVTAVASGSEAIRELEQAAKEKPYEIVLMDWKMPGLNGIETIRKIKENRHIVPVPKFVMVTAFGREEVIKAAGEVGVDGFLLKPVSNSILYDTLIGVMGHEVPLRRRRAQIGSFNMESLKPIRGARVLLVEDNELNRQVASELLDKAGLLVSVACNGREAVQAVAEESFELVLMDIQMPEMDGIEATRTIRADEKNSLEMLPIIAMTAHAMAGDRERSIEAGMNDHVTKPIDPDELFSALLRWIKPGERILPDGMQPRKDEAQEPEISIPEIPGVDIHAGLTRVGGNGRLYLELLAKFVRDSAGAASDITGALERSDCQLAQRLAHTVKGTSGNIGAMDLYGHADALEKAIKNNETEGITPALATFEESLQKVLEAISSQVITEMEERDGKVQRATADSGTLRRLLLELREPVEKQKPKQCKTLLAEIAGYSWPEAYSADVAELGRYLGRYKFKEARDVLVRLLEKL